MQSKYAGSRPPQGLNVSGGGRVCYARRRSELWVWGSPLANRCAMNPKPMLGAAAIVPPMLDEHSFPPLIP